MDHIDTLREKGASDMRNSSNGRIAITRPPNRGEPSPGKGAGKKPEINVAQIYPRILECPSSRQQPGRRTCPATNQRKTNGTHPKEFDMRKQILAAVAAVSLGFSALAVSAADEGSWTGALIDNHCGENQKDEAAAMKHPVSCALKDSCAASGYQLIVKDKHYKLDDKGSEQAKAYLEKVGDKDSGAKVTLTGKVEGDKIDVTSIKEAK
jgi:hypothetical protein